MKRRNFFSMLLMAIAGTIIIPKVLNESIPKNESWNHLYFTGDEKIYFNGKYDRELTRKEIQTLYNGGYPLTYNEIINKKLKLSQYFDIWVNGNRVVQNQKRIF